ncbi:hypothetical protein SAMN04488109_1711 [Chryseolinea serpens]|uniref:Uncharacterized protein n=1 Tax=Chryseolinea serpens TaxID=947013 RepID=A0A1M5MEJ2_9BACT|nr:hypothetical protein [Chryseolinea serpens]SHG75834.1 hypothetical protein SAMN04488109_1711 [Chryseolinea serpens]
MLKPTPVMKTLSFVISLFLWRPLLFAQSSPVLMGAPAAGCAYASSCTRDEWALFNNVAGLADVKNTTAAFTYNAVPSFKLFNRMAAAVAVPVRFGVAGVGVYRLGNDLYNEQLLTAGFSNTFGLASLGIRVNYVQYNAAGFGTKGAFSLSFGGIATLTPALSVGAHIINLNQPVLSKADGERLPTVVCAGIGLKVAPQTRITTEVEKDLDYPLLWKTGLEYRFQKKVFFRTGFAFHPNAGFFGFGFKPKTLSIDYAFQYTGSRGAHHEATVAYVFNRKQK